MLHNAYPLTSLFSRSFYIYISDGLRKNFNSLTLALQSVLLMPIVGGGSKQESGLALFSYGCNPRAGGLSKEFVDRKSG